MRISTFVMGGAVLVALVAGTAMRTTVVRAAADVSGSYVGSLEAEGQPGTPTQVDLKQDGDKLTGKVGDPAKPDEMLPLTGEVDGADVTFSAKPPQGDMKVDFALKVAGDHLKGGGTFTIGDQKLKFTIDLAKK